MANGLPTIGQGLLIAVCGALMALGGCAVFINFLDRATVLGWLGGTAFVVGLLAILFGLIKVLIGIFRVLFRRPRSAEE